MPDRELEELFGDDAGLRQVAHLLRSAPQTEVAPDPAFRAALRRRLAREAWEIGQRQQSLPWYRRWAKHPSLAWSGAVAGVLLMTLGALIFGGGHIGGSQQVASPLANQQMVPVGQSIALEFPQPMEHRSTEQAVQIQPATQVRFDWPSPTNLQITPSTGSLAPGTRYQVRVAETARTASGQPLPGPSTVTFVTAPSTLSPPSASPPSPIMTPGSSLVDTRQLGSSGGPPEAWSLDGRLLYVVSSQGQLLSYSAVGSRVQTITGPGVRLVAAGPAGPAYTQDRDLIYDRQTIRGANARAIGFSGGRLIYVSGSQVLDASHAPMAGLSEQPNAASFSPDGAQLAYLGTSGLHLLDLSSGKDRIISGALGLGAWSPTGGRYSYPTNNAVLITAGPGSNDSVGQIRLRGVTSSSWSRDGRLALATSSGVYLAEARGGDPVKLLSTPISQVQWSPSDGHTLAYQQNGAVWIGRVTDPQTASSQADLVNAFLAARKDGNAAQASVYLDDAGKGAFKSLPLIYTDGQVLTRYAILVDEPGRVVVRLVIAQGDAETAVDEMLALQRDAQGRLLIHGANDLSSRPLGRGPEVVSVQIADNQVQVAFDSDLDPTTISGVAVVGKSGTTSYDKQTRTVTILLDQPLQEGTNYQLQVSASLRDVSRHSAVPYSLTFVGHAAAPKPTPTPTPSHTATATPAPTASPVPSPSG
jgi:hypothetical protein